MFVFCWIVALFWFICLIRLFVLVFSIVVAVIIVIVVVVVVALFINPVKRVSTKRLFSKKGYVKKKEKKQSIHKDIIECLG